MLYYTTKAFAYVRVKFHIIFIATIQKLLLEGNLNQKLLHYDSLLTSVSYSMVVLYCRDHRGIGFFVQKYHPKASLHDSLAVSSRHTQANKCLQSDHKIFT